MPLYIVLIEFSKAFGTASRASFKYFGSTGKCTRFIQRYKQM